MIPAELIQIALQGGPLGIALFVIWVQRGDIAELKADYKDSQKLLADERQKRNDEGLLAAQKMFDQKSVHQEVTAALALRDYRIEDITKDLERCEQQLGRCRDSSSSASSSEERRA